ncbi:hypothetical protein Ahy_B01g053803 isoform A [Arachis hypogaea]|uniref:Uncharacterized protein n=1 Tax=Arachis hypogaea TaxID=3818 RepID=A0A445ASR1_ARAHY|nr:hypothetical protein Ahy_B01g053803 isoform A [Arachis hypogaea]
MSDVRLYLSSDTTCQADENEDIQQEWFTPEFLNDIKYSELPNHKLTLKPGVAGQSLSHVGLYLSKSVFTHGQLYVALSRVKSRSDINVLILDEDGNLKSSTKNVVLKEDFNNI